MGANHTMICMKAKDNVKFVHGGLEAYTGVKLSDITFAYMDDEDKYGCKNDIREFSCLRNYWIYSWLTDYAGCSMPMDGWREALKRSKGFLNWLTMMTSTGGTIVMEDPRGDEPPVHEKDYPVIAKLHCDEGAAMVIPLNMLLDFNYDEVARIQDSTKDVWIAEEYNSIPTAWTPEPDGKTWRELFTQEDNDYFTFLEKAKARGYDAVLISVH